MESLHCVNKRFFSSVGVLKNINKNKIILYLYTILIYFQSIQEIRNKSPSFIEVKKLQRLLWSSFLNHNNTKKNKILKQFFADHMMSVPASLFERGPLKGSCETFGTD